MDVKLFIKDEPLTIAKKKASRERIICCLSLEDQVIDQMLFGNMIDSEVRNFPHISSKVGWSPIPEGFLAFNEVFQGDVSSLDKSAWDWTMPEWVVRMYFNYRFDDKPLWFRQLAWSRFMEVVGPNCVLRLPDGSRVQQEFLGFMKSGWLLTIGMNSFAQVAQLHLAALRFGVETPLMWAVGDDAVVRGRLSDGFLDSLRTTGCLLKHSKYSPEFMGMKITSKGVQPLYKDKHVFNLSYIPEYKLREVATCLCAIYALAEDRDHLKNLIDYSLFSWSQLRLWALGLLQLDIPV